MSSDIQWLVALSVTGFLLLGIEIFVPGAVLGILGALCLVGAVGVSFAAFGATGGMLALGILLVAGIVLTPIWLRLSPRSPLGRRLTLAASDRSFQSAPPSWARLVGQTGVATSKLRPGGIATIQGERVDVVSESGFIAAGHAIRVARVEGIRVIVEEIRKP